MKKKMTFATRLGLAIGLLVAAGGLMPRAASAVTPCDCDREICSGDGYEKRLVDFAIDQENGESKWVYQICNQKLGKTVCAANQCVGGSRDGYGCDVNLNCPDGGTCQAGAGGGSGDAGASCTTDADCVGACVPCAPKKSLDQIDFVLPGLSQCVTSAQSVTIAQVASPLSDTILSCNVSNRDAACPADLCAPGTGGNTGVPCQPVTEPFPLTVGKCVVTSGVIDAGECITIELKVAGEQPTLGAGTIDELAKVDGGPDVCTTDNICGPSCGCEEKKGCLTRTPGFWGTHPHITDDFLPVTVCGRALSSVEANVCGSATEAMCVSPGTEGNRTCDKSPAYAQLIRQLTAAKLNIAASRANGGFCGQAIIDRIAQCEQLCGANQKTISNSRCIEDLDRFNNSVDTVGATPAPFDRPGPANPDNCQASRGNGLIIGRNCRVNCQ